MNFRERDQPYKCLVISMHASMEEGSGLWGQNHIDDDDDDDVWSYGHVSNHGNGQRGPVATDRNTK
jgi:hypothetical protein